MHAFELIEYVEYLRESALSPKDFARLHHFAEMGRNESYASVIRYFTKKDGSSIKGNNIIFAERCKYVVNEIKLGDQDHRKLIDEAVRRFPMDSKPSTVAPVRAIVLYMISRESVLYALQEIESGRDTEFADSAKYDLLYMNRRYPPKAVAGLALERVTGRSYGPSSFKGGVESACFKALQAAGFTIVPKGSKPNIGFLEAVQRVLDLQPSYSWQNTLEMEERGELIRKQVPSNILARSDLFEPVFSAAGYSFYVEGSDGKGRKVESPWVRIYDPEMSYSATKGWYVVIHFTGDGRRVFLTLGCGSTTYSGGSLEPIDENTLVRRVAWARAIQATTGFDSADFAESIELGGNDLSHQFEKATAYARSYEKGKLREVDMFNSLVSLCRRLVDIYDQQRQGKDPSESRVIENGLDAEVSKLLTGRPSVGQGRSLSAVERRAVELRAMDVAYEGLTREGFTQIEDVSARQSYDFQAIKDGCTWFIEVKGMTSPRQDAFLLTHSELKLHQENKGSTVLVLVTDISIERKKGAVQGKDGVFSLSMPWNPDEWLFEPTAYRAIRRQVNS